MFPKTLPEFCIKSGCPKNGIVLDPFMGSGTTAIVAKRLGMNFIGFEINKDYLKIINRRLSNSSDHKI
jgi:DNA modification methylase